MAANEIHKLDIGTVFEITLKDNASVVNVSAASTKEIIFQKPDGTVVVKDANFVTDGSDGKIKYTTIVNDLDTIGKWKIQGRVELPNGKWSSDIDSFKVYDNLEQL